MSTSPITYLPHDLTIRPANRPQIIAWSRHAWEHWQSTSSVTPEQMLARTDWHTEHGRHAQDGRLTYWVLVPRDDPETTDILASVRVFKRDALQYDKAQGSVKPAFSYAITSVVTPLQHRRKGYGNQLLSILHHVIGRPDDIPSFPTEIWGPAPDSTGYGDGLYSTLWSDVGREYYRKCRIGRGPDSKDGWLVRQEEQLNWETSSVVHLASPPPSHIEILTDFNFKLPSEPVTAFQHPLLQTSSDTHADHQHFVTDSATSPGLLNFLHVRNHHQAKPSDTYGFISKTEPTIWAIWAITPADEEDPRALRITSFGYSQHLERDVRLLVAITAQQAKEHGCARITIWGLEDVAKQAVIDAVGKDVVDVVHRKEHLGAIAWYGPGGPDKVAWIGVEE